MSTVLVQAQPHALDTEQFVARHSGRNTAWYLLLTCFSSLFGAFGDSSVLLPNLVLRLQGPDWMATLPAVIDMVVAFVPLFWVAWLLRPEHSRRKLLAGCTLFMYLPLLLLAGALWRLDDPVLLRRLLLFAMVCFALARGLSILPYWELYSRLFSSAQRSRVMGISGGLGQIMALCSGVGAAWLVSKHSSLPFPRNYALSLTIFAFAGLAGSLFLFCLREAEHAPAPRQTLAQHARLWKQIITGQPVFRSILLGITAGAAMMGMSPLLLAYAKSYRSFGEDQVALLLALRPAVMIVASVGLGLLAVRVGAKRVAAGVGLVGALGIAIAPLCWGNMQLLPQILCYVGALVHTFALLSVMDLAAPGQRHHYLAIYYTSMLVPSLAPLLCGFLLKHTPLLALLLVAGLAVLSAWLFWQGARLQVQKIAPQGPPAHP